MYRLALHVPFLACIRGVGWCEIYLSHVKHHLQTYIPELFFQIYEDRGLVLAYVIEPVSISTLLGRSEGSWLAIYERCAPKSDEMDALVLVARCFEVNKSPIEEWE